MCRGEVGSDNISMRCGVLDLTDGDGESVPAPSMLVCDWLFTRFNVLII